MTELDPLARLEIERERTLFMFYGFRWSANGEPGGVYFKLAHSLSEALADLEANPGVADEGGYLVSDAFLETGEEPVLHVELTSLAQLIEHEEAS